MRLIQFENEQGQRQVGVVGEARVSVVRGVATTRELALQAIGNGHGLIAEIERLGVEPGPVYAELIEQRRVLAPLDHADPAHCLVSGTGLTHLGSASTRDKMHQQVEAQQAEGKLTDTMQMFQWGMAGGRPAAGSEGAQPEWFYKGDGSIVVRPGADFPVPDFAEDFGEEPELTGLYVIADDGQPYRIGFALGNEFSDHVVERKNYLYLAHSKLRFCSFGPEMLIGELPRHLSGISASVVATRCCGRRSSFPVRTTCATPWRTSSITTSSTASSCALAMCMCTSSAPRPCRSPTASRRSQAIPSRSASMPWASRCATVSACMPLP